MRFAPPPTVEDVCAEEALQVVRARHVAAATLLQRSPPGTPVDPRDSAAWSAADAAFAALPSAACTDAILAWHAQHRCPSLFRCPLGPRPEGRR